MATPLRILASSICAAAVLVMAAPGAALPDAAKRHVEAANKALARGDGIAAEAELQRALTAGATRPEVAAAMGEAMFDQSELGKARLWLGPGQFSKGTQAQGWRLRGLLERTEGNLPAAGKAFDRGLAANPKDPLLWIEIGRLRYVGGEHLQAMDAVQRALEFAPDNPRALEFQAELTRDALGYGAAIPIYEHALEQAPNDTALLTGYAAALGEDGQSAAMLTVTRRLIARSGDPHGFFFAAVVAARAGDIELARALLNRTSGKLAATPAGQLVAGVLELEAGNANAAIRQLAPLADAQPANQRVQLLLARALYDAGDYGELFGRFGGLDQRGDASPYLLTLLGRALENQGNRAAAAPLLDRAAAASLPPFVPIAEREGPAAYAARAIANPAALGAVLPYVRSLLAAGDLNGARRVAGRFVQLRPGSADAQGLMGDVELSAGAGGAALDHYLLSSRVRFPDQLLLRIGLAFDKAGQGAMAQPLLVQYLIAFPGSRLAARIAANQAAAAGDWGTARALLENLRLRGGNRDFRLLADLSLTRLRSGDPAGALEAARRARELQPASPVAAQAYAMALAELGQNPALARQLLEMAKRGGGDNPLLAATAKKLH